RRLPGPDLSHPGAPLLGHGHTRRGSHCADHVGRRAARAGGSGLVKVLLWHVHGSWTTAFVQGPHRYLVPVVPDRGPDGRGRAQTWKWPSSVVEVTPDDTAGADVDVVIVQRPEELEDLAPRWLGGRRPGRDVPCVYLEHNAPQGRVN